MPFLRVGQIIWIRRDGKRIGKNQMQEFVKTDLDEPPDIKVEKVQFKNGDALILWYPEGFAQSRICSVMEQLHMFVDQLKKRNVYVDILILPQLFDLTVLSRDENPNIVIKEVREKIKPHGGRLIEGE